MPSLGSLIAKVSLDYAEFELGGDRVSQASLKMGNDIERSVTKALAAYKKSVGDMSAANDDLGASMARASAGAAALAESEDQATARIKEMVARSLEAQQGLQQVAAASQSAADGMGALGASADQVRANVAAQTQAMIDTQRATVLMNDEMQALRTTMAQGNATFATLGDQYSRLDRAMATGKLSMQEYDAALAALGKDEDKRVQALNALTAKYDPLGAATRKLAADQALLDDAYKTGQVTTAQYQQALAGIKADQAVVELRRLADQQAQLERAFRSGSVSSADYKIALADIGANRTALSEIAGAAETAGAGMSHFGLGTAGARTEILRLANDLANGNFGRFDQSAAVLAERMDLLGALTSPLALGIAAVAAAAGVFAVAAYKGYEESDRLNKALASTAGYAGVTAGQIDDMAMRIGSSSGHVTEAEKALTELAASGKVSGSALESVGAAAVAMSEATGESVDKVVKQFISMSDDVAKGAVKMNEQYHFLTLAQYDEIEALQKHGDKMGAMKIAADSLTSSLENQKVPLGTLPGILHTAAVAWDGFWRAAMNAGKPDTPASKVAALQDQIQQHTAGLQNPLVNLVPGVKSAMQGVLADLKGELQAAEQDAALHADSAGIQSMLDQIQGNGITASQKITEMQKNLRSRQQIRDDEITSIHKYFADARAAAAANPGASDPASYSQQSEDALVAAANDKYKKPSTRSVGAVDVTQLNTEVQSVKDQLAQEVAAVASAQRQLDTLFKAKGISAADYFQQDRALTKQKYDDEIKAYTDEAAILKKGLDNSNLSAQQRAQINKEIKADQDKAAKAAQDSANAINEINAKQAAEIAKVNQDFLDSIGKQTDAADKQDQTLRDQIDTFGMTKTALDQLNVARADEAVATMEADRAQRLRNDDMADTKAIDLRIAREKELAATLRGVASDQATLDDKNQVKKQQDDVVKSWQSAIDGIGTDFHNGFLQMLTNGSSAWAGFTKSLVNTFETTVVTELYKAFAQKWVINVVANIAGLVGGPGIANQILQNNGMNTASGAMGGMNNLSTGYSALTKGYEAVQGYLGLGETAAMTSGAASAVGGTLATGMGGAVATDLAGTVASSTAGIATAEGVGASGASTFGMGSTLAGAASATRAIPVIGWILAGMALDSKMMSQGWNPDNGSMSGAGKVLGSGTMASYDLAKAIGIPSGIANILTGASTISRLFGRKDPQVDSAGVDGMVSVTNGFQGQDYTDWTAKGGFFRSDAHGTVNTPATQDQLNLINGTVVGTVAVINQLSSAIGGIDGLQGRLSAFNYSIRNDWRDQTNVTKSLTDLSNGLVDAVVPLDQYQQTGETLTQTAVRLTGVFTSTNTLADMLGKTVTQAFGAVGLAGAQVRLNLIAAAGGIDSFNSEVSAYYSAYYSSAEQLTEAQKQMAQSLATFGLAMPQSKDAFRDLVSSLDLTTAAGQNTFAALMALAPSFDQLSQAMQKAADAQQALWNQYFSAVYTPTQQLAMNTRQLQDQFNALGVAMPKSNADLEKLVENMDTTTQPAKDLQNALLALAPSFAQVTSAADQATQAAQQAAAQNLQTALGDVQTAYDTQSKAIQANIDSINQFITSLTSLKQSLALGSLSPLSPQDKYLAEKHLFESTSASAAAGDATAQGNLPQVAQDFLTASQAYNASSQAYVDDYNEVQQALSANIAVAQQQLSAAQQQLNATNQMVQGILNLNQTAMSLSDALKAYFAAGGTTSSASAAGAGMNRAQVEATTDPTTGLIPYSAANPYGPMGGYTVGDWQNSAGWLTPADLMAIADQARAASAAINGSHAGGLDSVPFDGYRAELHKGEAVVTSANNQKLSQMLSIDWSRFGGNDQTALLNEIRALRAQVSNLKGTVATVGAAQMQHAEQLHIESKAELTAVKRNTQNGADATNRLANKPPGR